MKKYKHPLVVIADGEHARFVRADEYNVLRTETRFDSSAAHKKSAALRSDHPGASYHGESSAHHAMTPRHDPHTLEKEHFCDLVAHEINAMPADAFDALVLVAPAHSLSAIQHGLATQAGAKLVGTLHKDLVKTPDDELSAHLAEFLFRPHPPRQL